MPVLAKKYAFSFSSSFICRFVLGFDLTAVAVDLLFPPLPFFLPDPGPPILISYCVESIPLNHSNHVPLFFLRSIVATHPISFDLVLVGGVGAAYFFADPFLLPEFFDPFLRPDPGPPILFPLPFAFAQFDFRQ
jgi:hypothetical protein